MLELQIELSKTGELKITAEMNTITNPITAQSYENSFVFIRSPKSIF